MPGGPPRPLPIVRPASGHAGWPSDRHVACRPGCASRLVMSCAISSRAIGMCLDRSSPAKRSGLRTASSFKGHAAAALMRPSPWASSRSRSLRPTARMAAGWPSTHPPTAACVEAATGSLGHGLPSLAVLALSGRIRARPSASFVLLRHGEKTKAWVEAAMFAAAQKSKFASSGLQHRRPPRDRMKR